MNFGEGRSAGLAGPPLNGSAEGDVIEAYGALGAVVRALRHMSDGFLLVEPDGRIAFSNEAADRLLGSSHRMIGRRLWDVPAFHGVPDLADRCRRAMADDRPADLDIPWPGGDCWYNLRIVPVPDGLTLTLTDITGRCAPETEGRVSTQAADRAALMEQLSWALAEAVTTQNVVTAFADSVLPAFHAAGLIIATVENARLYLVGGTGYSGEFFDQLSGEPFPEDSPTGEVLRTRIPLFFETGDELVARYPKVIGYPLAADEARVFLPLIASGRVVGVGVLSFDGPSRLCREERTLLTALSGLIAQALERARLYDDAAARARELQRDLLPRDLPSLPAVSAAAHYQPAGHGTEVGGDWYDIIPLSADRVALVIGDVMGHGLSEAATMGRLRTAVRTLSDLDLAPDDVLDRLNGIVGDLGEDSFATCLYGIYDPVTGDFSFGCAGHPPPAVVSRDGTVTYLTTAGNPPLGAASPPFDIASVNLPEGTLVVLYTDGLVEAADRDIENGMMQLAWTLGTTVSNASSPPDLETLCDTLATEVITPCHRAGDDAALLLVRTRRLPAGDVASWPLPEDPKAAGQARRHVRNQLAAWDLSDLLMTTELLVSELVGNVIRHAKGPIRLRLLRSRTLICEVSDGSLTTPLIRRSAPTDEGGRGLQLVSALAQRWGTRYTSDGKTIWTEQQIPG